MEMWGVSVCPLAWTGMLGWGHKARRQIHRWGEHTVLLQIQIQIQTCGVNTMLWYNLQLRQILDQALLNLTRISIIIQYLRALHME